MKDFIAYTLFLVVFTAIVFIFLYVGTSPEWYYSGMHDSECEKILYGSKCHCHERLVANDKKSN